MDLSATETHEDFTRTSDLRNSSSNATSSINYGGRCENRSPSYTMKYACELDR